jgi:hypothetical protein
MRPNLIAQQPNSMEKAITQRAESTQLLPSSTLSLLVSRASRLIPRVNSRSKRWGARRQPGFHTFIVINLDIHMMSSRMPPVPPANRSKEPGSILKTPKANSIKKDEKHHNSAEEGDTANIKQNKTNKGFFRGRREG